MTNFQYATGFSQRSDVYAVGGFDVWLDGIAVEGEWMFLAKLVHTACHGLEARRHHLQLFTVRGQEAFQCGCKLVT